MNTINAQERAAFTELHQQLKRATDDAKEALDDGNVRRAVGLLVGGMAISVVLNRMSHDQRTALQRHVRPGEPIGDLGEIRDGILGEADLLASSDDKLKPARKLLVASRRKTKRRR